MPTTTDRYLVYPALAGGVSVTTGATAWVFTGWTQLVPLSTITANFSIVGFSTLFDPTSALDIRHEAVLSVGLGGATLETEIAQLPFTFLIDTAAGYTPIVLLTLAEPIAVAANNRVAIRWAWSGAIAKTFGPTKLWYRTV